MVDRCVAYSRGAQKTLARIDRATSARIRAKIDQYAHDPGSLANNVVPLKGEDGFLRLRVGEWRVVFTETLVVVLVVRVGPRGAVYD